MLALKQARLLYLAPHSGLSGVGDYADDFIQECRQHFGDVVEFRHRAAAADTAIDLLRQRRKIQQLLDAHPGPTVVHAEQSGGVLTPFWALAGLRRAGVISATMHDPPLSVWTPFRTRGVNRSKILTHALHFPLQALNQRLEQRVMSGTTIFALTSAGAREARKMMRYSIVRESFHPVPDRPAPPQLHSRPRAVGLYGYVYRGKGFDSLSILRSALSEDIELVIAGRGTEKLPPMPGVRILGEVDAIGEAEFFSSIRALLIPYGRRTPYGPEVFPASGSLCRSLAYRTPALALRYASIQPGAVLPGTFIVEGGPAELARQASELLNSPTRLSALEGQSIESCRNYSMAESIRPYLSFWANQLKAAKGSTA